MRHIVHGEPPQSIKDAFREQPLPTNTKEAWNGFNSAEVRESLWELQHGLCAYCERTLPLHPGSSSIDHVVPKSQVPSGTFRYSNLLLCCSDPNTCNLHKRGKHFEGADDTGRWREGFIAPTQPRCATSFVYKRDGSIAPSATAAQDDAKDTLKIVNLNFEDLKTERREYLERIDRAVESMADQLDALRVFLTGELALGSLKPFYSAKLQHFSL
jgi:uncharacterized protein (TIGR02646 family)